MGASAKVAAIGEVIRRRQAAKRERGEYFGNAPFGWRYVGGQRLEEPGEQATLRLIVTLDADGASLRDTALALIKERRRGRRGNFLTIDQLCRLRARLRAAARAAAPHAAP